MIDGNKNDLDCLYNIIMDFKCIDVIGVYNEADTAYEELLKRKTDVVFMEISLPNISGLGLAGKIYKLDKDIDIVFVSDNDNYGVEAFRLNVVDYVLKPVTWQRISLTIEKIKKRRIENDDF